MKYIRKIDPIDYIDKKQYISAQCKKYNISNYSINSDNSINVYEDVNMTTMGLSEIPIKFEYVKGNFNCSGNKIRSLLNSPREVDGDFNCSYNDLGSLLYSPDKIGGNFDCSNNHIQDLRYITYKIPGYLDISRNELISLEYFPMIMGEFNCNVNPIYPIWYCIKDKSKIELFNKSNIINNLTINITIFLDFLKKINKTSIGNLEYTLRQKHWRIEK